MSDGVLGLASRRFGTHPSHAALVPRTCVCHLPYWKEKRLKPGVWENFGPEMV
jgi:hypothetical protein